MSEVVKVRQEDRVLTLSLNRGEVANAFNQELVERLRALFLEDIPKMDSVHVVVLEGEGRHFSAGADLSWMKAMGQATKEVNQASSSKMAELFWAIDSCPKPVIAKVQGAARGGGVGLVATADIAVGSTRASFALTEVRLGLAPAVISPFVGKKLGASKSRELFLTGERFSAEEAFRWGLLNHVVEEDELDAKVKERISHLLLGGPGALAASKALARSVGRYAKEEAIAKTSQVIAELRVSEEGQEGMRAFLEKDAPRWTKGN